MTRPASIFGGVRTYRINNPLLLIVAVPFLLLGLALVAVFLIASGLILGVRRLSLRRTKPVSVESVAPPIDRSKQVIEADYRVIP